MSTHDTKSLHILRFTFDFSKKKKMAKKGTIAQDLFSTLEYSRKSCKNIQIEKMVQKDRFIA